MEVKTGEMDAALENVYGTSIDTGEVNNLLQQVQEEAGMEGQANIGQVGVGGIAQPPQAIGMGQQPAKANEVDEM